MKIKNRLIISFAISICLMVLLASVLAFWSYEIIKEIEKEQSTHELVRQTTDLIMIGEEYLVYRYHRTTEQWNTRVNSLNELLNKTEEFDIVDNLRINLDILHKSFLRFNLIYLKSEKTGKKNIPEELVLLKEELSGQMRLISHNMIADALRLSDIATNRVNAIHKRSNAATLAFLFFIISIAIISSYHTLKRIIVPLSTLVRDANVISNGNLKHKITSSVDPTSALHDEITELSLSFSNMTNNLVKSIEKLETEVSERIKAEDKLQKAHDNLEQQVEKRTVEIVKSNELLKNEVEERKLAESKLQGYTHDLAERVKELNCLYQISKLIEKQDISLKGIIKGIVDLMPSSWQYPEITCARIILENQEFKSENFIETAWKQTSEVKVKGLRAGFFEICYLEETTEMDEGPFLKEERRLINAITKRLGRVIEHKKAEEALRESEKKYRMLIENMNDGIASMDENGVLTYANDNYSEILGYKTVEIVGKNWMDLFDKNAQKVIKAQLVKQKEGKFTVYEVENTRKDGKKIFLRISPVPIFTKADDIKWSMGLVSDITEHKYLEEQLQRSQKLEAIGTLAGGIAHDFNNMLGVITGNISYMLSRFNQDEELVEVLTDVQECARQAQNLTHQLITFAKGGAPIKKTANIKQIIEESVKFVLRGTKSRCDYKIPNDLWSVEVDPGQMNQVFTNLVLNAIQTMPDGGTIQIQADNNYITAESNISLKPGQYIKIMVKDQGAGISKKNLTKIFDPYFSTKHKSKGLGLATTHSIINKHDGLILVESQINKGTTFYIYLPAVVDNIDQVKEAEKSEQISDTGQNKILIMDDQESILKMLDRMLKRMGYETVLATDGAQSIELYREAYQSQKPFDVVILDLTVPGGMGGAKTIPELLRIDPNVKAVVSSGYSNDPVMSNYKDYGFCGVIPKPYSHAQMAELLNKIFNEKS